MSPDRVSNPGPLTYESGALPIALRGPARKMLYFYISNISILEVKRQTETLEIYYHYWYANFNSYKD